MRGALLAIVLGLGAVALAGPASPPAERVAAELDAARRARVTIEERLGAREGDLATRVRALYKLTRGGLDPLWVDGDARAKLVSRRAAARRMILRDLEERQLLARELEAATRAEQRLGAELTAAATTAAERLGTTLKRPVVARVLERAGRVLEPQIGLERLREGVVFDAAAGVAVVCPLAGTVSYVGPARGLGTVVLVDGADQASVVVGGLASADVLAGAAVERGVPLGAAAGPVYLQLRLAGRPVDPARFLTP